MRKTISILSQILLVFVMQVLAAEIHDAARKGDFAKVKTLLEKDPKLVNVKGKSGSTPLHFASEGGHFQVVKILIEKGAKVNIKNDSDRTPLVAPIYKGHKEIVELLIKKGADINVKAGGQTPVHWAAEMGQKEIAYLLINKGAVTNTKSRFGGNLLHSAVVGNLKELVELLISQGADVNARDKNRETPLDQAYLFDRNTIVPLLKAKGGIRTPPPDPEIEKLVANVYMVTFPYNLPTNMCVFTGSDGILLVDTGYKRTVEKLSAAAKDLGKGDIKYIINTHLHGDHNGGNKFFKDKVIKIDLKNLDQMVSKGIISRGNDSIEGKPGKTFETYYTLKFNEEEIRLIPAPGTHSDSDMIIYFTGSKVVQMGDIFFAWDFRADEESEDQYLKRIKKAALQKGKEHLEILENMVDICPKNTKFIGGHGRDYTLVDIKKYLKLVNTIIKNPLKPEDSKK